MVVDTAQLVQKSVRFFSGYTPWITPDAGSRLYCYAPGLFMESRRAASMVEVV
jgi:hypothetical protein